jgi:hypothetical protein
MIDMALPRLNDLEQYDPNTPAIMAVTPRDQILNRKRSQKMMKIFYHSKDKKEVCLDQ